MMKDCQHCGQRLPDVTEHQTDSNASNGGAEHLRILVRVLAREAKDAFDAARPTVVNVNQV